jgi:hypothetical protein
MPERFTSCGKEVLRDGQHFADALHPRAAEAVAIMLNKGRFICRDITEDEFALVREEVWS